MKLTVDEAVRIIDDEHELWIGVTEEEMVDHYRWSISMYRVFKHIPSGKHYGITWMRGATEQQWQEPFEGEKEVIAIEVRAVEKVVIDWVPV